MRRAIGPWRRGLNWIGGLALLAIGLVVVVAAIYRAFLAPSFPDLADVAHAGGAIDGMVYTNSIAALDQAAADGFTVVEVDFVKTSDGVIVCGHDWEAYTDGAPDHAAFLAGRGSHSPCTVDELVSWMEAHPEATLVSDAKVDVIEINRMLRERLAERLLPQAYDAGEMRQMLEEGSPRAILTLYKLEGLPAVLGAIDGVAGFGERVAAITMPDNSALAGLALWAKFRTGRPVMAHTVNNCTLSGILDILGVDAIYTDRLPPGACAARGLRP